MSSFTAEQIEQAELDTYRDRCAEAEIKLGEISRMVAIGGKLLLSTAEGQNIPVVLVEGYIGQLLDIINKK